MAKEKNDKHVMLTIVIGFVMAFIFNTLSWMIFPPVVDGEFPVYGVKGAMMVQLAGAFLLIGLTVIGMKAEEEKQILAAAGFTAQAISFGVAILSIFDVTNINSVEQYEKYYLITVSSNFLYVLALILIASYNRFRSWVRVVSVITGLPFMLVTIMFILGSRNYHQLEFVTNIGVVMVSVVWLIWAWNIFGNYKRNRRKELLQDKAV